MIRYSCYIKFTTTNHAYLRTRAACLVYCHTFNTPPHNPIITKTNYAQIADAKYKQRHYNIIIPTNSKYYIYIYIYTNKLHKRSVFTKGK